MALPIFAPHIPNIQSPSDIMGGIARTQQAMQQARFVAPLLRAQLKQRQAQTAAELQESPLKQQLLEAQAGLAQAKTKKNMAIPLTKQQELIDAQNLLRDNVSKFGKNDIRTLTAASNLAKISDFKGVYLPPKSSSVQVSSTNTPQVNASINLANAHTDLTTEKQAADEINKAIPASTVTTPEQQKAAQPEIKQQQNMNQEATNVLNSVVMKANKDPFSQGQATQLNSEWKNINSSATIAAQTELPLYKSLVHDLQATNLANPVTGHILWTTPAGQKLQADLTRAQGEFIKSFHLGRMTQLEFNFLKNAIGKATTYPSALRKLFTGVMGKDHQALLKAKFYHKYITGGGRKSTEVDESWLKSLPDIQKDSVTSANNDVETIRIGNLPVTVKQLETLEKNNPTATQDQILDTLRVSQQAGKI